MRLKPNKSLAREIASSILLLFLAFWMIWRFALGTTPLRPDEYCWDSAFFQVVGKLWADGLCPYADIFDHKGPLLFLIQKIAYHFDNPRMALYSIESLFVGSALLICHQTLKLCMKSSLAFAGTVLLAVFWLPVMEYGNLCETYSMPFVLLSLWLQLRYLSSDRKEHPWWYAFLYGICFGANLMIRPNNGLLIAVITFVITLQLALRKQWKNIALNALALIAGVLLSVLPFIAYFAVHDVLSEFMYANWTFNLVYASNLQFSMDWQSLRNVLFFITPALICLLLGGSLIRRRIWLGLINVLSSIIILAMTLSGIGYAHYFMLHVPLIPLALYTASQLCKEGLLWKWTARVVCIGFALLTLRTTLTVAPDIWVTAPTTYETAQEQQYDAMIAAVVNQIPPEEHNQVAICGLTVNDAEWILKTDLQPMGRYCFLMEWHAQADPSILTDYMAFLNEGSAKWLITRKEITSSAVFNTIDSRYELAYASVFQDAEYQLYRIKDE